MRGPLALAAMMALLAGPALAWQQPASSDPIGDVLSGIAAGQGMDDDPAEDATPTAADRVAQPAPAPPAQAYSAPAPYIPPAPASRLPQLDRPVMIDELYRTPEAPPTSVEQAYESRIRGGFNAAQGLQGPLDGGWVLRGPDGRTLYGLQLVDKGTGGILLEGAWRSLKTGQTMAGVGLVDSIERTANGGVNIRFTPRGAREASILQLDPAGSGWNGTLWEAGVNRSVTLRRN